MAEHASQAYIGWGSVLYVENAVTPGIYDEIHEVTAFTPPQTEAEEVDVTHFQSPGARREFIAGMIDSGEASATINYNPRDWTDHDRIADLADSREKVNWRFTLPEDIETIDFNAYISAFNRALEPSDVVRVDVTWRVSTVETARDS
jgi:hypothetical protein